MSIFAPLDQYSPESLSLMGLIIIFGGTVIGFLTDSIMGKNGFGVFGNTLLTLLGVFVSIYMLEHTGGVAMTLDSFRFTLFAASTSTAMLLVFGAAKHLIMD